MQQIPDSNNQNNTDSIDWMTSILWDHGSSPGFQEEKIDEMLSAAVLLCIILGCLCITLNLFIINIIIRYRRKFLKNIFYFLVFHCSVVDLLRGCCLIVWGLPHIVISNQTSIYSRLFILKISQFTTLILRSCNLLTIFNLLIFTCNEFAVVHYPLVYNRRFTLRAVVIYLFLSWLISFLPGIGSVAFSSFFKSAYSIVAVYDTDHIDNGTFYPTTIHEDRISRRNMVMSINILSMLMTFFLCYLSLFVVLFCYGSIMFTIRCLRKENQLNQDRHKYMIVIGSSLFVYVLFLLPYSGVQLVTLLHINDVLVTPFHFALIKWSLEILTGIHAVCQPLCYFRMVEFRRLACSSRKSEQRRLGCSNSPSILQSKKKFTFEDSKEENLSLINSKQF